ncbi:4'-phosphopantetheinyl transferase family protein [Pseudomonas citronellolis]|uniref:4'-phosphopantetheinyl transferase family protein n=1 Tax=Pseudomonas citronellolis TaxID=53408 RepID=UPI0023E389E2|nr:4'-phosphopantetheinyl transferase superfamily protein [Pseudomonas citronellolis]MDF3932374.1 4'-phosphopantetheinyl transferase superfamily protein [Pseudomonas citronellolis]
MLDIDDFLTPPQAHWPLPQPLPGALLHSCRFDPQRLDAEAFARHAVDLPPTIGRAVAKRRAEFLAGRLCARAGLQALTGLAQTPGLAADRAPIWPGAMAGSITHGDHWAAAVVARREDWRSLGLDVETLLDDARASRLVEEILTPAERQRLDPHQLALGVTLTFSLKESLFKALYPLVGRRFYFEHAELLEWDDQGHARLRLLLDLSAEWHAGRELDAQFARFDGRLLSLVAVPG